MSLALGDGFLTTGPPRKSQYFFFKGRPEVFLPSPPKLSSDITGIVRESYSRPSVDLHLNLGSFSIWKLSVPQKPE